MYNFTQHDVGLTVDKIVQIFTECSELSHFLHPLVTHKIISVSKLHALEMLFPDSSCFPPAINRIEHIFKSRRLQIASESEYQTYLKQTFIGDLGRPPVASPVSVGQGGNHPVLPLPFQFSPPPYPDYRPGIWQTNTYACKNCFHLPTLEQMNKQQWICTCGHQNTMPPALELLPF